ncbi:Mu transposase C-terminal domain-containing protein [Microbacterium sp. A8/3-1]|uniref:Mu transposase C-terminal domain-containing protein n=1 Tax=Microbacterium sp. A8/3-1 TaxID=3160749 RepID=A0AAU7W0H6_9MICO
MNKIRLWEWVVLDGIRCQVVAIDGATVEVQHANSLRHQKVLASTLVSAAAIEQHREALSDVAKLSRVSPEERARCEFLADVLHNHADESARGLNVEHARQQLAAHGIRVSERQVWRYLAAYRAHGIAGLIDRRRDNGPRPSRVDPRILELIEEELSAQQDASTGTQTRAIRRIGWNAERIGLKIPSRATMFRLLQEHDRGRSSFGSATTRRSKALRPQRTFHGTVATRPGELVEFDSTPLDVIAVLPDGSHGRPELTYAIDVATGTICGTLLRAGATKSVDIGAVLLARMLTPLSKRPGWPATRDQARALLGPGFLPTDEEWQELAETMPLIVPESVTVDRGKVFAGSTFTAACERLEISQIIANPRHPTDKPHVEGGFKRIRDGFVQYLAGFTGGSVADRGAHPKDDAVWTVDELQILLDLWVLTSWQTTPQSGLRLPDIPRRTLSPNQMYQVLAVAAPQVAVGLAEEDYIALMPIAWRTIQPYGINLHGLVYDNDALHPLRGRSSGLPGPARGRWEVRFDPYNLRQVWVRDHRAGSWICAAWTLSALSDQPFSGEVLRAARATLEAGSGPTARGADLLEEITRIQRERAETRTRTKSATALTDRAPILRIVSPPTADETVDTDLSSPPRRLRILE